MNENRELIENRIFQIIGYIKQDTLLLPLKQNIGLFSIRELLHVQDFLETGNFQKIYILLDEKYKEYLGIIEEIKNIKIKKSLDLKKNEEEKERLEDNNNLELLINF